MRELDDIPFGPFVLNRRRGVVEDAAGRERILRPKSYRVLEYLCERPGRLVGKDELADAVWPDVIVSDDSLAHCIADIRRALGADGAAMIRTVPRRGYLLSVAPAEADGPSRAVRSAALPAVAVRATLPAAVAAGLLCAAGLGWWIAADRDRAPVAAEAGDVALGRAGDLLRSRDWRLRADNERARALLEEVLAAAPDNPAALAALGLTYWLEVRHLAWGGGRREMETALRLVESAIAHGGGAAAHRLLAEMRLLSPFREHRSPLDALANARAAVALDPDDPDNVAVLAEAMILTGRPDEATALLEARLRLGPASPDWHRQVAGLGYLLSNRPARAVETLGPVYGAGTFANARWWAGWLYAASLAHAGRLEEARRVVAAAQERRPEMTIPAVAQSLDGFADPAGLAVVLDGLRLAGMRG